MNNPVTYLDNGKLIRKDKAVEHDYAFTSSDDFFSLPSNLIPGLAGVSGGRVLLGSKATLQALSLNAREAPLVQSVANSKSKSSNAVHSDILNVIASAPGKIKEVTKDHIVVTHPDGDKQYDLYNYYGMGRKSFVHHTTKVKVGDSVNLGALLAVSNYSTDDGHLALGKNLTTALMPFRSGNFEDAIALTETGANKLISDQVVRFRVEKAHGVDTDKNKFVSIFPNKFFVKQTAQLDNQGVIQPGAIVNAGDPLLLSFTPRALKSADIQLGKLSSVFKHAFNDHSQTWQMDTPGEVVDVSKEGNLFTIAVKTTRPVAVGDKLSNAFGAKGVVGVIVPDSHAPHTKDGTPVDLMLNSMSVTSRVAPAIVVSMALGKVAQKIGKPVTLSQFTNKSMVAETIDELKKHKLSDTEELYDPTSGTHANVMTGPLYFTRLTHIAEDKESSRGQGSGYSWDLQPTKVGEESAKRLGNLHTNALLSHGAKHVLEDIGTVKATKNDEFWHNLKLGLPAPSPKVPFVFNKFIASLQGAGVKIDKKGGVFSLMPMTNSDVLHMSSGPITDALTYSVKDGDLKAELGGLFDPAKVGALGERYNHIPLQIPIPNPISETFLRKLVGVSQKDYLQQIVDGKISASLSDIDIEKKITEYKEYVKSGKKSERHNALQVLSFLQTLKTKNLHPKDLILHNIPVIPAAFRPIAVQGDLQLPADVNNLYKDLILANNAISTSAHIPDDLKNNLHKEVYGAVKAIYGFGDPINPKNKERKIKGLLATTLGTHGGSGKLAMFQARVVNKPLDLVGRAVLTPDASLGLDEASVPQDILWKTYSPFIIRRLVQKGVQATLALDYTTKRNPLAAAALAEELKTRPGIISRDPALHKYNLTGFYLKPNISPKDSTIKLNPLVFKPFNADNDGDQLNINIPAGEDARKEVIAKMLPSSNIIISKTMAPAYIPLNESALGLFQASTEDNKNIPIKYKTNEEALAAFQAGKAHIGDRVEIG